MPNAQSRELPWGRRYVMVRPDHFRVDYRINPYMDLHDQPDAGRAMAQWVGLVSTIERLGGTVEVVPQRADAPDMVYAMNLGLGVVLPDGRPHVVMSHMRYAERRVEMVRPLPSQAPVRCGRTCFTPRYAARSVSGRHTSLGQEQASCLGGLVAASTLNPAGPRLSSTAFCHALSVIILAIAVLIFSQVAVSPFLMPMP